ncbi:hypothetical protein NVSP9465_04375 [Novosphingobium sp. CECT 9465]|nr:hypothetical protein NVSP9465_04375 [Novosphingobium sp. CECT 9465]
MVRRWPLNGLIRSTRCARPTSTTTRRTPPLFRPRRLRDVLEHLYSLVAKSPRHAPGAGRSLPCEAGEFARAPALWPPRQLRSAAVVADRGSAGRHPPWGPEKCWRPCRKPATWPSKPFRASSSTRSRAATSVPPPPWPTNRASFSSEAIEDYDAALAKIDALLARYDDQSDPGLKTRQKFCPLQMPLTAPKRA